MIFCSACGQKNEAGANFCAKCGKQIISIPTAQPPPPLSTPPTTPAPERSEQKSSGIVTALAVVGFVFGLIGMLGSFLPIIGIFAIKICIGAAVISGLSIALALSLDAKRTFPIVALTVSLIGVGMWYLQISKINSATRWAREETAEMFRNPLGYAQRQPVQQQPVQQQSVQPIVQNTMQQQDASHQPNSIKAINANITKIGFFESPSSNVGIARMDSNYRTSFEKSNTRFIYWQMQLAFPVPNRRVDFMITAKWYDPLGNNFYNDDVNTWIESNWINSYFAKGWGSETPGAFAPGNYRVDFYSQGEFLASGHFTVF